MQHTNTRRGAGGPRVSPAECYRRDLDRYTAFHQAEAARILAEWDLPVEHANLFAHAQAMHRDRELYGHVREETEDYARLQNERRTLESIGQPFNAMIEVEFDGTDFIDQRGERELAARLRGVMAAVALEETNPDMAFYTQGTIYEFGAKMDEIDMMQNEPVGTVMGLVSPCRGAPHLAKQLGFLPNRDMAAVQLSYKISDTRMGIKVFSLDGATPELLLPILREHGLDLPDDLAREDFLGYRFWGSAKNAEELQTKYAGPIIRDYDFRASAGETRQGQHPDKIKDVDARFKQECQKASDAQLYLDEQLSKVMGDVPAELPVFLRQFGQRAIDKVRNDGKQLLSQKEKTLLRNLLASPRVSAEDPTHAEALRVIKRVHETAVDDIVWRYFNGETEVLDLLDSVDTLLGGIDKLIDAASTAAENGRYSAGCGSDSTFGQELGSSSCEVEVALSPCCGTRVKFLIQSHQTTCMGCGTYKDQNGIHYPPGHPMRKDAEAAKRMVGEKEPEDPKPRTAKNRPPVLRHGDLTELHGQQVRAEHVLVVGGTVLTFVNVNTGARVAT